MIYGPFHLKISLQVQQIINYCNNVRKATSTSKTNIIRVIRYIYLKIIKQ
jgi:hypothetical protein